jgi:hypothetical protein
LAPLDIGEFMKVYYLIDKDLLPTDYPEGHIAGKLADFLNNAMEFNALNRDFSVTGFTLCPAESSAGIICTINNESFFTLSISATNESVFLGLYDAYKLVLQPKDFIGHILGANNPVGKAFQLYEQAQSLRLNIPETESRLRKRFTDLFEEYMKEAPLIFLSEMKHHMQIIPNKCKLRIRNAHFKY